MFGNKTDDSRTLKATNPRTGKVDYKFPAPSVSGLTQITHTLRAAQPAWRDSGVEARAEVLGQWRNEIEKNKQALYEALSIDTGRNTIAAGELGGFIGAIDRWCAEAPALLADTQRPSKAFPHITIQSGSEPYQLMGAISPWNFPLLLAFIDALPALMAGCAAFVKPSEVTPRFVEPLAETIAATPGLRDVLHIAAGDGETGAALIPLVDVVAFTGSVATGRKVGEAAAKAFIPAFLELGGKDPAIVLEGSDLDRASTALLRASVIATGQACQSIERIYVAKSNFDEFVSQLTEKAKAVPLTHDTAGNGIVGPLIFGRQADIIANHLQDAVDKGATIRCGGVIEDKGGKWIAPTVVIGVTHDMKLMTEETFGPIMPVMAFDSTEEAIRLANDTVFGLSATVFGPIEEAALAVGKKLDTVCFSINDASLTTMIFEAEKSGFKLSGMGPSRMGPTGLTRFLRNKAYYLNRGDVVPIEALREK